MMQVTLEAMRVQFGTIRWTPGTTLYRCKKELQGLTYVLVCVINGTCAAFTNGELMHTTLYAS